MVYFLIAALVVSAVALYTLIITRKSNHLFYLIPVTLIAAIVMYTEADTLFGYPVAKTNEEKFILLTHFADEEASKIYLWVMVKCSSNSYTLTLPS